MRDMSQIDCKDSVRSVIRRDLKEIGIKIPKIKYSKSQSSALDQAESGVFGVLLENVPSVNVSEDGYCSVPKFIVEAVKFLSSHLGTEGLFRKSGSVSRQKVLKEKIESSGSVADDAQPHDVAVLFKQFFRELPEPLLTTHLHDSFIKAQHLCTENETNESTLQLCLMLPLIHLQTLQYAFRFFARVASRSHESKMSMGNLAIVLAPNLMPQASKKDNTSNEKIMKDQRLVIERLLQNAHHIGMVREDVLNRAAVGENGENGPLSSGDELDGDVRRGRNRHRTGSIHGLVSGIGQSLSRFKGSSSSTKTPSHRRSRSVPRVVFTSNKYKVPETNSAEIHDDYEAQVEQLPEGLPVSMKGRKNSRYKRKPVDQITGPLSPPTKSRPALMKESYIQSIGQPSMVSIPNQMFTTPTRPIVPLRPLSDFVKKGHGDLLKVASEHVKVVDVSNYVPSPETPTTRSRVRASPVSPVLSLNHSNVRHLAETAGSESRPVRPKRRLVRRHSSGAVSTTRCFNSSPKTKGNAEETPKRNVENKFKEASESPVPKTPKPLTPLSETLEGLNVLNNPKTRKAIVGHSGATPVIKKKVYTERGTPREHHRNTPPHTTFRAQLKDVVVENVI